MGGGSTDCKTKSDNKGENKVKSSDWGWKIENIQHKEKLWEWKEPSDREQRGKWEKKTRERGVKLTLEQRQNTLLFLFDKLKVVYTYGMQHDVLKHVMLS